ncbi:MAG: imidazole glycerol phosphate synthase subunit HisH [Pseudomonadota bacterium]|jgi:glutamine amidotransferase
MNPIVTVIDYGVGNLLSVTRAFTYCGAEVILTDDPSIIRDAARLVLPGVGAFADGMFSLQQRKLVDVIQLFAKTERPLLGICLGMQMLMDSSEEFGFHQGLGLISGKVIEIPKVGQNGVPHKIPHIGWNLLQKPVHQPDWQDSLLTGVTLGSASYFVHSFMAMPDKQQHRFADTNYNGQIIPAVIRSGNIYGCQFHPEKSGEVGLQIIKNFLML